MCGWLCVCSGARWHVFGFGKLAYSHAQFSKWSERCFSLSIPLVILYTLWRSLQVHSVLSCSMLHAPFSHCTLSMKPKRPPPLLFLQSTAYLSGRVCSSEGTWGDSGWGRRTIYREEALRRFLSWRWRDICFSFLRPSHSLVLWHYVFRRGHCSCLHGKAEDVGLCTCFLCFKWWCTPPFPVHITNMFFLFAVPSRRGCINPAAVIYQSDAECYRMTCSSAQTSSFDWNKSTCFICNTSQL